MISDEREVTFCRLYARLGNIREAAIQAGLPPEDALAVGLDILGKKKNRRLVKQLRAVLSEELGSSVVCGLMRLAFGDITDAVRLLNAEEPLSSEELSRLDLINVSEIKRVKGGGMEIKFFDRQKAMEKLLELSGDSDRRSAAQNLLGALIGDGEDEL